MRPVAKGALAAAAASALSLSLLPATASTASTTSAPDGSTAAGAPPPAGGVLGERGKHRPDNLSSPLAKKQIELRNQAINLVMRGKRDVLSRTGSSDVVRVAPGRYAEISREASDTDPDQLLTFLVEFGRKHKKGTAQGIPGPLHNQIPRPDRNWNGSSTDDNTTFWRKNFSRGHYLDMFFGDNKSMKHFYKKQSNGKYNIDGDVSRWVKVPFREARYGYDRDEADGYWNFIKDSARAWYRDRVDAGWSNARIRNYLSTFDEWDRYDHDGDGDFEESDGYIDHFQAVHAGEGQEAGAPAWTIWSHRWYAFPTLIGVDGPSEDALFGGVPIGRSGYWIGDYTTEPENGGLGVFAHEYAHDLGLADYYDTAGGENGTGFWTLMSSGSWMNDTKRAIGTKPNYMGPHEKLLLGWLDYELVRHTPGTSQRVALRPAPRQGAGPKAQALAVLLPEQTIVTKYNEPHSGNWEWWGGSADDLNVSLTHTPMTLPAGNEANMRAWAWYDIEEGYDYLYFEVRRVGETRWTKVREANHPDDGIDGESVDWERIRYDLSEWTGDEIEFRFRYQTDTGVHYAGPFLDDFKLSVDGNAVFRDNVEDGTNGWTTDGWQRMDGTTREQASHYYLAENRQYVGYDRTLKTGPYNFSFPYTRPDWVDRFSYQDGLLVWYVNNAYEDNNTSVHPGYGWALPVDAMPKPLRWSNDAVVRNRIQSFDATFGTSVTDAFRWHTQTITEDGDVRGLRTAAPVRHQKEVFDDSRRNRYWSKANPTGSVKVAGSDTRIKVLYMTSKDRRMDLRVSFE